MKRSFIWVSRYSRNNRKIHKNSQFIYWRFKENNTLQHINKCMKLECYKLQDLILKAFSVFETNVIRSSSFKIWLLKLLSLVLQVICHVWQPTILFTIIIAYNLRSSSFQVYRFELSSLRFKPKKIGKAA